MNLMHSNSKRKKLYLFGIYLVLIIFVILFVGPFLWVVCLSFDKKAAVAIPFPPSLIPKKFTFEFYRAAIKSMKLGRVYANTFLVLIGVNIITVTTSFLSGYALSKLNFKGKKAIFMMFMATLMLPIEVRVFPLFAILDKMNLINSYWCFWLPAAANGYMIFLAKSSMDSIPTSLREAGLIDGASDIWIFRKIFVPLSTNGIVTVIILTSMGVWNDLLYPMIVLLDQKKFTIQIMLSTFKTQISGSLSGGGFAYPGITMAGTILTIIPMLIMYLFLQKYIMQSIAMSGIKQ